MKLIVLTILVLLLVGMTDARMPVKGDRVNVMVSSGSTGMLYVGTVEDIGNGLICMNCTSFEVIGSSSPANTDPHDVCLGIGNIIQIRW